MKKMRAKLKNRRKEEARRAPRQTNCPHLNYSNSEQEIKKVREGCWYKDSLQNQPPNIQILTYMPA